MELINDSLEYRQMTEPHGSALATVFLGFAVTAVDGNTLIGAFAGATLFVMSETELSHLQRVVYLVISIVMGYLIAPSLIEHTFINQPATAGFIAGLLCITFALQLKNINLIKLLRGRFK
jgi:hypothetical protein